MQGTWRRSDQRFILKTGVPAYLASHADNEDVVVDHAQTIVIGNPDPDFLNVLINYAMVSPSLTAVG